MKSKRICFVPKTWVLKGLVGRAPRHLGVGTPQTFLLVAVAWAPLLCLAPARTGCSATPSACSINGCLLHPRCSAGRLALKRGAKTPGSDPVPIQSRTSWTTCARTRLPDIGRFPYFSGSDRNMGLRRRRGPMAALDPYTILRCDLSIADGSDRVHDAVLRSGPLHPLFDCSGISDSLGSLRSLPATDSARLSALDDELACRRGGSVSWRCLPFLRRSGEYRSPLPRGAIAVIIPGAGRGGLALLIV